MAMRWVLYSVAFLNIASFMTAVVAKSVQLQQAHMLAGNAGNYAVTAINLTLATWYFGLILIYILRRGGPGRVPLPVYAWLVITGVPILLYSLALLIFLLPAFL